MKYPKSFLVLYGIALSKIIGTIFVLFVYIVPIEVAGLFSIYSIFFCFAAAYHPALVLFCFIALILIIAVWVVAVLSSLLGIFIIHARKSSIFWISLVMLIEFVVVLIPGGTFWTFGEIVRHIIEVIISIFSLVVSVKCFIDMKKVTK